MHMVYWGKVDSFYSISFHSIPFYSIHKTIIQFHPCVLKAGSSGRAGKRCRRSKSRTHFTHVKRSKSKIQQDVSIQINHQKKLACSTIG